MAAWNAYLQAFHAARPNATPQFFARHALTTGATSYAALAADLHGRSVQSIVDLGCGNGRLIDDIRAVQPDVAVLGVDFCAEEIERARARYDDERTRFVCTDAATLPLADASADAVLSHMAFMLMTPAEVVVDEIVRVLCPGGTFSAIVGREFHEESLLYALSQPFARRLESRSAHVTSLTADGAGIPGSWVKPLFERTGAAVTEEALAVRVVTRPDDVWNDVLADLYFTDLFNDGERAELARETAALARTLTGDAEFLDVRLPLLHVRARMPRSSATNDAETR